MKTIHYRRISLTIFTTLLLTISSTSANLLLAFQFSSVSAQTINSRETEAEKLIKQAVEQYNAGQVAKARQLFQQALAIAKANKEQSAVVTILQNLSEIYLGQEDYAAAIDVSQQGLAIAREIPDSLATKNFLDQLGQAYYLLADWDKAIRYCQQSLALAQGFKDPTNKLQPLLTLANIYYYSANFDKAIDNYQQILTIYQQKHDRLGEGQMQGNIGLAYATKGEPAKAIPYLEKDLAIEREFHKRLDESQTLGYLAIAYDNLTNYSKAVEYFQQSIVMAREVKYTRGEAINLRNLGNTFFKLGKLPEAEKNLRDAIEVYEFLRKKLGNNDAYKVSIFEAETSTYQRLQEVLIAQNKINEALEISEQGRSRAFVELLTSRLGNKASDGQNLEPNVAKPTLSLLQQIAKQHSSTIVEYSVINHDYIIGNSLQSKESELYIWVINKNGKIAFRKVDLEHLWQKDNTTLNNLVNTVRNNIGARGTSFRGIDVQYNPDNAKTSSNLRRLHELLISKIEDLLPKNENEKVIFIPHSGLFLVPFAALQDTNGKYLIQKHTILTSPSIQVLGLTRKQEEIIGTQPIQGKNTLIVGNPTMPSIPLKTGEAPQQLAPLPGAEKEAIAIGNLLNTQPLIGNQATKSAVLQRLPQARFVHLATHGIFDDVQGLNSSIALAPNTNLNKQANNYGDGFLTAGEILDLKLNAELVVLSACDTGRGRITGDGVIGLSRSLISAGVPSVLVSLWSVPDSPTSLLMTQFYQNLQKNPDKATALRFSMLETMKKNPNPVDWAAFTLIGEAQ